MLTELLHDATIYDRQRMIAECVRHAEHDGVRRGVLAAWRDRRAAARHAARTAPRQNHPVVTAPAPAVARG